jgi:hypothetical protein
MAHWPEQKYLVRKLTRVLATKLYSNRFLSFSLSQNYQSLPGLNVELTLVLTRRLVF